MQAGKRILGSLTDVINKDYLGLENILLCIWHNKDSSYSVVRGIGSCKHYSAEENSYCPSCGAWIGHIGEEEFTADTYDHIFWIVNQLKKYAKTVIIKSDFPIPEHYKSKNLLSVDYKKSYSHYLFSKAVTVSSALNVDFKEYCFMTVFSDTQAKILESPSVFCPNLAISDILLLDKLLIVNPDRYELENCFGKNYLVCNTRIYDELVQRY